MIFSSRLLMNTAQPLTAEGYPLVFSSKRAKQARDWSITGSGIGDVGTDGKYHLNVVNEPLNLFNAQSNRLERTPGNYSSSTSARPNLNGKGIYKGFAVNGGYYAGNAEYIIHDNNSIDLTYIGNNPYGVGFDFHLKPNTYYVCNSAENSQYIGAVFYKEDGTYINWMYVNNNKKWMIPDECYWTLIVLAGTTTDILPVSFTNIGLYEAETLQPFEPYREPTITEVVLDEPINGTATHKGGVLPPLQVCEGTNIITIEATNEPTKMSIKY